MAKKRIILVVIACFSVAVLAVQTPSFMPPKRPHRKPGMTDEEYRNDIEKAHEEWKQQRSKASEKRINLMAREAWKRLLRISERQWKLVEPKIDAIQVIGWTTWACAVGYGGEDEQSFHWYRHSEGAPLKRAKAPHEMSEGERLADELVDLLRDENSSDEDIRKKIDAIQKVREKARKELDAVGRELAPLLTTTRQEAIFLIMGYIN